MSQQNPSSGVFPSAAAMRVNEEIKRLQQIQQRMRAAACPFPSSSAGGGLLPTSNMQGGGYGAADNQGMGGAGGLSFNSRPMLASFLAQQQQQQQQQQEETRRLMLLDQLRFNMPGQAGAGVPNRASFLNDVALPSPSSLAQQQQQHLQQESRPMMRVGTIEPFPEKLMRMLTEVENCGRADVISFINNGTGFAIHKPDTFFKEIVPLYFRHSRLSSFKRQLNLYGFVSLSCCHSFYLAMH